MGFILVATILGLLTSAAMAAAAKYPNKGAEMFKQLDQLREQGRLRTKGPEVPAPDHREAEEETPVSEDP